MSTLRKPKDRRFNPKRTVLSTFEYTRLKEKLKKKSMQLQGNRMKLREWRSAQCCFQKVIIPASALPANTHAGFSRQTFKHV